VGVAHIADVAKGMRGMCLKRQQKVHKKISETTTASADCPVLAPLNICLGLCQDSAPAASAGALLPTEMNWILYSAFVLGTPKKHR